MFGSLSSRGLFLPQNLLRGMNMADEDRLFRMTCSSLWFPGLLRSAESSKTTDLRDPLTEWNQDRGIFQSVWRAHGLPSSTLRIRACCPHLNCTAPRRRGPADPFSLPQDLKAGVELGGCKRTVFTW